MNYLMHIHVQTLNQLVAEDVALNIHKHTLLNFRLTYRLWSNERNFKL